MLILHPNLKLRMLQMCYRLGLCCICFLKDTTEQSYWHIATENTNSLLLLLNAIQTPWKEMFGVELKQVVHPALTFEVGETCPPQFLRPEQYQSLPPE